MKISAEFPPPIRIFDFALFFFVILVLAVSPNFLVSLGIPYTENGGSALSKLHPATYCGIIILALAICFSSGSDWFRRQLYLHPGAFLFLGAQVVLIIHVIVNVHRPITGIAETYFPALVAFFLLKDLSASRLRGLAIVVDIVMTANAVIAIIEFATGVRLIPLVITVGDDALPAEWRSTAIFGHPLANAIYTGSYLLLIAMGSGRELTQKTRIAIFALNAVALVTFGGRAATLLLIVFLFSIFVSRTVARIRAATINKREVVIVLAAFALAAALCLTLNFFGFFDKFLTRISEDNGSAGTRVDMFALFNHMTWWEIFFGTEPRHIEMWEARYGLTAGIESFWIAHLVDLGIIMSVVLWAGIFVFFADIVRVVGRKGAWLLLYFILCASASNSIGTKSNSLTFEVTMLLIMLPRVYHSSYFQGYRTHAYSTQV